MQDERGREGKREMQPSNLHHYFHVGYYENLDIVSGQKEEKLQFGFKGPEKSKDAKALVETSKTGNAGIAKDSVLTIDARNDFFSKYVYRQPSETKSSQGSFANHSFCLRTRYPGLVIGMGELHGVGIAREIAVGISLDYVTGLPVIPGSSLKGVLRAAFSLGEGMAARELLKDLPEFCLERLVADIFGDSIRAQTKQRDDPKQRDVFFDAIVVKGNAQGRVLALDTITPHRRTDVLELAEPTPLAFLRIAPDVTLQFRFRLQDSTLYGQDGKPAGTLRAKAKASLFKQFLCAFGIGAKTNVGYGILEPVGGTA